MSIKQIEGYTVYLSQLLGRGSFGRVYKGYCDDTKEPVAVKIIPRSEIDYDQYLTISLRNEIRIMRSVQSENIVKFVDVMTSSKNYYIVQQLCDGDLSQIIHHQQQLPENYCIDIITQICEGFLVLVKEGVIHRDLKPANILKKGNRYKLADFGFSKQIAVPPSLQEFNQNSTDMKMKTTVGTPLYMSIEVLSQIDYTSKCDIWALGLILYQLLHGQTPWIATRVYEMVEKIQNNPLIIKRKDLCDHTVDFLQRCLQVYEKDRISWNQIFVHPIFNGRFLNRADQNKQYQNKMKTIMTKLRYYFHFNRIGLETYLNKYGYKDNNNELSFENYYEFLKVANPHITYKEANYIFKKTDLDGNGAISLDEILMMLKNYGIAIQDPRMQIIDNSMSQGCIASANEQTIQLIQIKIFRFFQRLYKMIQRNKLTLKRVFDDFDHAHKGYLVAEDFREMTQKMMKEMTNEEAFMAFNMIDRNNSSTIDYNELSMYYNLFNQLNKKETP